MITHFAMKRPARVSNIDAKQGANTSKTGTTLDIVTPSGLVGDVIISGAVCENSRTWTPHTGFTEVFDTNSLEISRRTVDGSEAATLTFTANAGHGGASGFALLLRGGTYDTVGSASAPSSTPAAPSITLTGAGRVYAIFWRQSSGISFTTPTGFTYVAHDADGNSPSWAMFYKDFPAGATGTVSSSVSSGSGYGVLVGVKAS